MSAELLTYNSKTKNQELLRFFGGVFALANPGEYISIGKKSETAKCGWIQKGYRLSDLFDLFQNGGADIQGEDIYFAPNTFKTAYSRTTRNLASFNSFYIDLDYDKVKGLKGAHPEQVLDKAITCCIDNGLPRPSIAVYTGHGLHLYWLLDKPLAYSPANEKNWSAVQQALCGMLEHLGADWAALDAARVLRIPGTVNAKDTADKREVYCVYGDPEPRRVGNVMMLYWAQAHSFGKTAKKPCKKRGVGKNKSGPKGQTKPAVPDYNKAESEETRRIWRKFNNLRAADLEKVVDLRKGAMTGCRNEMLFCHKQSLYYLWENHPEKVKEAVHKLNDKFTQPLTDKEVEDVLSKTVYYKLKTDELICRLHITDEEQTQLKVIVSEKEKKRRRTMKNKCQMDYAGKAEFFCVEILSCLIAKMAQGKIAERLNVSRQTINNYIKKFGLKAIAEELLAAGKTAAEQVKKAAESIVAATLKPRKSPKPGSGRKKKVPAQEQPTYRNTPPEIEWPTEEELATIKGPLPVCQPSTKEEFLEYRMNMAPKPDTDYIESIVFDELPPKPEWCGLYNPRDNEPLVIVDDPENDAWPEQADQPEQHQQNQANEAAETNQSCQVSKIRFTTEEELLATKYVGVARARGAAHRACPHAHPHHSVCAAAHHPQGQLGTSAGEGARLSSHSRVGAQPWDVGAGNHPILPPAQTYRDVGSYSSHMPASLWSGGYTGQQGLIQAGETRAGPAGQSVCLTVSG